MLLVHHRRKEEKLMKLFISMEIPPYLKKPRLTDKLLPLDSDLRVVKPSNFLMKNWLLLG